MPSADNVEASTAGALGATAADGAGTGVTALGVALPRIAARSSTGPKTPRDESLDDRLVDSIAALTLVAAGRWAPLAETANRHPTATAMHTPGWTKRD
jgi:hypothetical protein